MSLEVSIVEEEKSAIPEKPVKEFSDCPTKIKVVGCGGGGAHNGSSNDNSGYTGGAGYRGQVIITYQILTLHITLDANGGTCSSTGFDILYYNAFGSNLPTPELSGYDFLGYLI